MISREDIRARAAEWQLTVGVVEKDYVLGWLLAALAEHPEASQQWVFKGGTCLKKCFFETYRFSEDLDFSLLPGARYSADELQGVLREVAARASVMSGIEFPPDMIVVRDRRNLQGAATFEGRIAYRGPMADPSFPRVRFDLTRNEPLLDGVARRSVFHAFPDMLPGGMTVGTYTIDELFAEKLRALAERTRPRDLYDVVFILENRPEALNVDRARELFREKCRGKQFPVPDSQALLSIIRGSGELRSEWGNMLAHQLPELPPVDAFLARIDGVFAWMDERVAMPVIGLPGVRMEAGEEIVAAAGLQYWGTGVGLEAVRFAGTNRLLVEFVYKGTLRRAEPYSLRRARTGNTLLYAWEQGSTHIKAFDTRKMSQLRATGIPFNPRYRIEFMALGPMSTPPARVGPSSGFGGPSSLGRATPSLRRTSSTRSRGPVYVYECTYCGRKFEHSKRDSTLRRHKDRGGYGHCPGRRGTYVDTRYP